MGFSSQGGHVILRSQAVKGTLQADIGTAGVAMRIKGGSLAPNRDLMIPDAEIGGGRDVADAYLGAVSFAGDYEFYPRLESVTTLIKSALGAATSNTVTGVTTHVLTPIDTAQMPLLSLEEQVGDGLEVFNYTDGLVNTFHLESEANGFLSGTAGMVAIKQVAGATPTASPLWDDSPLIVGTNITVTLNGVTVPAKSFSFDVNNNYETDYFRMGSFYLGDLTPKRREVTAQFSVRPDSSAMWRQAVYGSASAVTPGGLATKSPLVITATTYESIVGGTPTTAASLKIEIPQSILKPFGLSPSGDDVIENDVEVQAVRPSLATPIVTVTVKSARADIA